MHRWNFKFWNWFGQLPRSRKKKPSWRRRLEFEPLEDRTVPSANASGAVTGFAFIDHNSNGVFDAQDFGIPGVSLFLSGTADNGTSVNTTAITDSGGRFAFENVLPGTYQLNAGSATGMLQSNSSFGIITISEGINHIANIAMNGGQTTTHNVIFLGLAPDFISLRQFLTNSAESGFPFDAAGEGVNLVNFRPNSVPVVLDPIANFVVGKNSANTIIDLAGHFSDPDFTNSLVRFHTSAGEINVELFDTDAPRTVANFFNYVLGSSYDNSIFHRMVEGFVLQGGGFTFDAGQLIPVATDAPVQNEFGASNVFGTIAMAKVEGDPDSATSQFFFNLADNSENLDEQNDGFTVFGQVVGFLDELILTNPELFLSGLQVTNQTGFNDIPMVNYGNNNANFPTNTTADNFFMIFNVEVVQRDEFLTYDVVSNSNPNLVTATVENNRLILNYEDGATGTATITIRATDRFGATVETSFELTVENRAPEASVVLEPDPAFTNDTLTATVTASDPDGDDVTLTYVWFVDDVEVKKTENTTETTDTLDASNFAKGQVVRVEVTPNDGTDDGETATFSLTIGNSLPVIDELTLTPDDPAADAILTAEATVSDADDETVTLTYVWEVNGVPVQTTADTTSLTDTLDLGNLFADNNDPIIITPGDIITVTVTPNDGTDDGESVTRTINWSPTTIGIVDQFFSGSGNFVLDVSNRFSDPDNDPLTFTATLEDGSDLPEWLSFSEGVFSGNPGINDADVLIIVVTATNPGGLSASATFEFTVSNTPDSLNDAPVIDSLVLSPLDPTISDQVTATVTVSDGEGDPVTLTYVWFINDVPVHSTINTDSLTDTLDLSAFDVAKGDTVSVEVTPFDGIDTGNMEDHDVTVANSAPVIETLTLTPDDATATDVLTAAVTASDVDGDTITFTYVWTFDNDEMHTEVTTETTATLDLSMFDPDIILPGNKIAVTVTPNDGTDGGASVTRTINWSPTTSGITDQFFSGSGDMVLDVANHFSDPDNDPLTFTATLDDGSDLPEWLSFSEGVFSGNPGVNDAEILSITVTATDPGGLSASATFQLTVSNTTADESPDSLNDAPVVESLTLLPEEPAFDDELTVEATVFDADNDPVTLTYVWFVNNVEVRSIETDELTDTLDLAALTDIAPGDEIRVEVTPHDGHEGGATQKSTVTIV